MWVVCDNQGRQWVFDLAGSWLGAGGRPTDAVVAEHDGAGRVVGLAHSRGRRIDVEYAGGRVVAARCSDGQGVEYGYDDQHRLICARSVGGGSRRYAYNDQGLISRVVSGAGVVECVNTYDVHGRVVSQESALGRTTRFVYLPGGVTGVSDVSGERSNTWITDSHGRTVGVIDSNGRRQSLAYDQHGNLVSCRDRAGEITVHFYDQRGRVTRTVLPSKAAVCYEWDEWDRLVRVVTGGGSTVSYQYAGKSDRDPSVIVDPAGGVTRLCWSDRGLLEAVTDPEGVQVRFGYDGFGDLVSCTNANGDTARLVRDRAGRVVQAITPMGQVTRFAYDVAGCLVSRRDPDGATYAYSHDAAGRVTSITAPDGGVTAMEYGPHGQVVRTIDPLGRVVERGFDDLGNVNILRLPDGARWFFNYDGLSRLSRVVDPGGGRWEYAYSATGELVATIDSVGVKHQTTGRASQGSVAVMNGDGSLDGVVECDPYGRPVKATDVAGDSETVVYDACGRPTELLDADGGLTKLDRDLSGRVVALTTPEGRRTTYSYDACGRVETITGPDGGVTAFSYDADSRVIAWINPVGEKATYCYDLAGRLSKAFVPGVGSIERTYDTCGRLSYSRDLASGTRRFKYDLAGQLVQVTNGVGGVTRYGYDERGRVVSVTDPLGNTTRRTYNELDKVTSVTDPLGRTTTATYDAAGRQLTQTDPDGITLSFEYDKNGARCATYADGRLLTRTERELVGRMVRLIDHTDPADVKPLTHTLTYDWAGRLVAKTLDNPNRKNLAKRTRISRYSYGRDGHRTSYTTANGQTTGYRYNQAGQVVEINHPILGHVEFTYDKAGRLTGSSHDGVRHQWAYRDGFIISHRYVRAPGAVEAVTLVERDTWGRVATIKTDDDAITYTYDQAGQLTHLRTKSGLTHTWGYDQAGHLTRETRDTHAHDGKTGTYTVYYVYDEASQLTQTTTITGAGVERVKYFYTRSGRRQGSVSGSGTRVSYDWDARGWLTDTTTTRNGVTTSVHTHVDGLGLLATINYDTVLDWDYASPIPALTGINGASLLGLPGGDYLGAADTAGDLGWRPLTPTDPVSPGGLSGLESGVATTVDPVVGAASQLPVGATLTPGSGLSINGHHWSGARFYDPATHAFLTPDPLADPAPGALWETNPYNLVGNNPLALSDPTGYKPVTDAQLAAYAKTVHTQGALSRMASWEFVTGVALAVAGGVLTATGVGGPVGLMLIGAGTDMSLQKLVSGKIDYGEVALSGALGPAAGFGAGSAVGVKAVALAGAKTGAAEGFVMGNYRWARRPGPHTLTSYATQVGSETTFGTAFGAASASLGAGAHRIYDLAPDSISLGRFGPMREGALPADISATFRSASYDKKVCIKSFAVYRAWGGLAKEAGGMRVASNLLGRCRRNLTAP
ncbi:MAG: RHS repeat-associated core domain-containing protein [Actinomycetaceae bacterium]|nr:RHS repeat-associated core domain-containing protein [Actinomycetaceae bacterium]MDU0969861.1 RHS repeat-associated core domain-containing protein [Actinomycetaceae bacterium]